jgi:hypothetical protein
MEVFTFGLVVVLIVAGVFLINDNRSIREDNIKLNIAICDLRENLYGHHKTSAKLDDDIRSHLSITYSRKDTNTRDPYIDTSVGVLVNPHYWESRDVSVPIDVAVQDLMDYVGLEYKYQPETCSQNVLTLKEATDE